LVLNSPRGTGDIFGEDIKYRDFIINTAKKLFNLFNYNEIITPAFEHTEVFNRSIGESTDIVQKEMYTFLDKKGRSLTLRPEGTAPVIRAVIERKLYSENFPLKLFYIENMFRYERPQKGRMREFWQVGVEAVGLGEPFIDVEVIWLLNLLFEKLGFNNLKLLINSVGCSGCRKDYIEIFRGYLKPKVQSLCPDCITRYEKNPLRIFDCKVEECMKILKSSPKIYSYICDDCKIHLDKIAEFLEVLGINFTIKEDLVRGFDYYTRTIFEIISEDLKSAQNALGGGGRYDKLVEQFGGPDIPSIGFAVGIDRVIILMKQLEIGYEVSKKYPKIFIILMEEDFRVYSFKLAKFFRENNLACEISCEAKSVGSQIKWAEKNEFSHVVIIGEDEIKSEIITLKDLKNFRQFKIDWIKQPLKVLELFQ